MLLEYLQKQQNQNRMLIGQLSGNPGEKATQRLCELKEKEVVNICNGKCLGGVVDLQINECSGAIEALIVPGPGKFCGFFGTDSEYVIPFACIKKIGPDIILVEIKEEKFLQKY